MRAEQKLMLAILARAIADYLGAIVNSSEEPWVDGEALGFLHMNYPMLANRLQGMTSKRQMLKLLDEIEVGLENLNG